MTDVLQGFLVIGLVVFVGYLVGKWGVLGPHVQEVLGKTAFFVFTPALIFTVVSEASPREAFSTLLPVSMVTAAVITIVTVVVFRVLFKASVPRTVIATLGASYVNSSNMGIPLAAYILGDAALALPVIVFQVVLTAPIALTILDIHTRDTPPSWGKIILSPLQNPLIVASILGALMSWEGLHLPELIAQPVDLLGQAAVPTVLFLLGWTMVGTNPLKHSTHRTQLFTVTALKVIVMPLVAWLIAHSLFGLEGKPLFTVVMLATLPVAQNVFTYAVRYGDSQEFARDTVVVTTVASLPALVAVTMLLGGL